MMAERFASGMPKPRQTGPIPEEPASGRVIAGTYTLVRLIGRGGVGDVYLAKQAAHGGHAERDVVVKLLAGRWMGDADAVARFEREARRLRALEHPNIVTMFDAGVDCGRPFLVTEWIDGESLGDFNARAGHVGMREFVPIAAQILKGVGHAHSREMMIRDIKPSNIMLCERKGRANFVKLLDFGLAKFLRNETPLTEGYVLGTAGYLAPEAILGGALDLRVDVYALGVLFYRMLAGVSPFEGCEDATIFYKTLNEHPRDLRELLPIDHEVPEGLVTLIHDCLAKEVTRRPADANIVVERLIDVVPAMFFRLPSVPPTGQTPQAGGTRSTTLGNTGLIQLLDRAAPRPAANSVPQSAPTPVPAPTAAATRPRSRLASWAAIAAVAGVVSAVTAWSLGLSHGRTAADEHAAAEPADAAVVTAAVVPQPAPKLDAAATPATSAAPIAPPAAIAAAAPVAPSTPSPVAAVEPEPEVVLDDAPSTTRSSGRAATRRRERTTATTTAPATGITELPPPPPEPTPAPPSAAAPSAPPPRRSVFLSAERRDADDRTLLPASE